MLADDELGPPENILMHYSAEGKTNEGKGEDERTKGMDGRGRRKGGKLKFQSSVFSANTPPSPSPSLLSTPPLPLRAGFTFVHDARSRVIFKRNEWPLHLLRGYISRTRRHCNFPRHRHRYHELVIDAFHYSRGDDSTETATYRSSGGNFPPPPFFYFIFHDVGRFLKGRPRFESIELATGGGEGRGEGGEKKRKIEGNETWNVCGNTSYNLWRMRDGMKINKVRWNAFE